MEKNSINKKFTLNIRKVPQFINGEYSFYEGDLEEPINVCVPGEWVSISIAGNDTLGFVNHHASAGGQVTVLRTLEKEPLTYISNAIDKALEKRSTLGYGLNSRLIYGDQDGLPGLVVDSYEKVIIAQINKAGFDKYRNEIKDLLEDKTGRNVHLLDNEEYRKKEGLPIFEGNSLPEEVTILENGIRYALPRERLQKVGYYYDHRENRLKLQNVLQKIDIDLDKAIDLFCYIGSWGLNALRAGVKSCTFVDQADMEHVVLNNVDINDFDVSKCDFVRADVFKFLNERNLEEYDVVISDPPAFTKSLKNKKQAILGYEKLHRSLLRTMKSGSILVAASCTKYVDMNEFDITVQKAAKKYTRRLQLIDCGIQGWDHPMSSFKANSNYIKYICYYVE